MRIYISPNTQQTKVVLFNPLLGASGGGTVDITIIDQQTTQQSGAMSPARTLYI